MATPLVRAVLGESPLVVVERVILLLRGTRVILDSDLARFYEVETRVLNQAVRRNPVRFPPDFMFRLTQEEVRQLGPSRSQSVILKRGANIKYLPFAFTQEGVAMLSSVLRSPRAAQVNVAIMRAFVRLRETLALHKDLAAKLGDLERKIEGHDASIRTLFEAMRQLTAPPDVPKRRIGFSVGEPPARYRVRKKPQSLRERRLCISIGKVSCCTR